MKLFPKARPVRIKLNVGGEEHSSLDSLRANFNVVEVLRLYESGGLQNWLRQINRLDIYEELAQIHNDNIVEKYKNCINLFFDYSNYKRVLKGRLGNAAPKKKIITQDVITFDNVLLSWQEKYPISYRFLLSTLLGIPSDQYLISVNAITLMGQRASKNNDETILGMLSEYLYRHVARSLGLIRKLKANPSEIKQDEYSVLSVQLKKEWNIYHQKLLDGKVDYKSLLGSMLNHALLRDYRQRIMSDIDSLDIKSQNKAGMTDGDYLTLQKRIKFIKSACNDVLACNLRAYNRSAKIQIVSKDPQSAWSMEISDIWFRFPDIIKDYNNKEIPNSKLMEKWSLLIVKSYLYKAFLDKYLFNKMLSDDRRKEYNRIMNFLNDNGGRNGLSYAHTYIYRKCNSLTFRENDSIRRKILQSSLYVCILMASSTQDVFSYMKDLRDSDYRPAILHLKVDQPKNKMEEEFMKLNNLERIPFVAEHILDF